jgi:hypothetical protein
MRNLGHKMSAYRTTIYTFTLRRKDADPKYKKPYSWCCGTGTGTFFPMTSRERGEKSSHFPIPTAETNTLEKHG